MKFFTHKTSLPISLMYFSRVSGCYPYTSKIRKSNIHLLHHLQSSSKKPLASNWQKTKIFKSLTWGVSPTHLTVESTVRFISGFPTKNEQMIFSLGIVGGWSPPLQSITSTTCATWRASPGENSQSFMGPRWVTLGGFHQPSGPPWEVGLKKSSHKTRQGGSIWWTWRIGSSFCWISIGFVLLVIFFFGGGGGAGDRPLQHVTLWLKKKRLAEEFPCQPSRHIFRNCSNHFHLFPAPHPPPPSSRMDVDFTPTTAWPSLAPRAWRSTAWAWPKVQRSSPPGVDAKWVEKIPNFWLLPKKSPLHTAERFVIFFHHPKKFGLLLLMVQKSG